MCFALRYAKSSKVVEVGHDREKRQKESPGACVVSAASNKRVVDRT